MRIHVKSLQANQIQTETLQGCQKVESPYLLKYTCADVSHIILV